MNVAGIAVWGTVDGLSHEQWQRRVEVNLMGPIHVLESFVPAMIAAGRGRHWPGQHHGDRWRQPG